MEYVENNVLNMLIDFRSLFYFRYADDIITAVPKSQVQSVITRFNAFHKRIQDILETETDNAIYLS
jgi:hypothetical protein